MKVSIRLEEDVHGKGPPALAKQELQHGAGFLPLGLLINQQTSAGRKGHCQCKGENKQRVRRHQLSGRRRKTQMAASKKTAA